MVNETFGLFANALSFGALVGVPITNSLPFQWNQMGITLGEPSIQTYASRAGILDCRSSFAAGCCKSDRSPCFTGMVPPCSWCVNEARAKRQGFRSLLVSGMGEWLFRVVGLSISITKATGASSRDHARLRSVKAATNLGFAACSPHPAQLWRALSSL